MTEKLKTYLKKWLQLLIDRDEILSQNTKDKATEIVFNRMTELDYLLASFDNDEFNIAMEYDRIITNAETKENYEAILKTIEATP